MSDEVKLEPCPELGERETLADELEAIRGGVDAFNPDMRAAARSTFDAAEQVWKKVPRIIRALRAIEATRPTAVTGQLEPQGEGWQPIESAPQDGRRVVVWAKHYNAPCSAEHNGVRGWCVMGTPLGIQPTHWQPLPDPPAQPGPSK